MKRVLIMTGFLSAALLFYTCSAGGAGSAANPIEVKTTKMDVWLNLMPGGPPSFHFAGEAEVANNSAGEINVSLKEVVFETDGKPVYRIVPEFEEELKSLEKDGTRTIRFFSPQNIKVKAGLQAIDSLSVVYVFSAGGDTLSIGQGYYKLERAY